METVITDEEIEQEAKLWIRHNHELLDYSDFHDDVEFDHAQVADLAELYRVGYRACEQKGPVIKDNADMHNKECNVEFNKSRIYTAVNADELKIGSKVYVADNLDDLQNLVTSDTRELIRKVVKIFPPSYNFRINVVDDKGLECYWHLAYLIKEPEPLKWTDLKIGDVVKCKIRAVTKLVTGIDESAPIDGLHILLCNEWVDDKELESWEKVEE